MNEKESDLSTEEKIFQTFNLLHVSFILLPHSPSTHPFSFSRVISYQTLGDTLECRGSKMCIEALLREQEHSPGHFPPEQVKLAC